MTRQRIDGLGTAAKGRILAGLLAAAAAGLGGIGAADAADGRLSIVSNGEVVGSVAASQDGDRLTIDYRVDDNGRGPKHREEVVFGPNGVPRSWTINGTSLMGGAVSESFTWANGRARWKSQADSGEVAAPSPKLYIVNDGSPWNLAIYARAALANGGSLDVLPGGRLNLTKLRDLAVGGTDVTLYRLDGVDLRPDYLMLDGAGELFATLSATGVAIREGFEKEAPALLKLGADLGRERAHAISEKIAHDFAMPVRIRNVRIFDPRSGTLGPLSTVVTMRRRITQILPGDGGAVSGDQVVIDGEGGTLFPGLHDMHSHTSLESGFYYLAAGVTETRDMGNKNAFLLDLLPRLEAGEVAGPHVVPAGFMEGRSPFSARNGIIPETLEEALAAVHWYADRGYREIKIYNSFNPDWVRPVAAEAHRIGLGVTGHVPAFSSPDRVIGDGYDTIAHINQLMLGWLLDPGEDTRTPLRLTGMARAADLDLASPRVTTTVALMKQKHVALDTTAVILERLMLSRAGTVADGDADYLSHMPIGYQRYRKRTFVPLGKDAAAEDARYRAAFAKILATIKLLDDQGVALLPGTDDGTGFTVQREVELYVKAGLSPAKALRLATLDAAAYLGQEHDRGTIERGKFADFVLVAGDPTRDIRAIKRPRMVVRGGTVYFPSEIYQALGIEPFAAAPPMTVPANSGDDDDEAGDMSFFGPDGHDPLHD